MPGFHIQFRRSCYVAEDIDVTGSGILPYFIDRNGVPHFLLGKEQYIPNWKGSLRWSGFEGGRKDGESVEKNAAREFIEETTGVIAQDITALETSLKTKNYSLQICFSVHNTTPRVHVTFVKEFKWIDNIEASFDETRSFLATLQDLRECVSGMKNCILVAYPYVFEGNVVEGSERPEVVMSVKNVICYDDDLMVEYITESNNVQGINCKVDNKEGMKYLNWFTKRKEMFDLINNSVHAHHPAITSYRMQGYLYDISINPDYLEKVRVKLWDIYALRQLAHSGTYGNEALRPYFLPVIKTICEEFLLI
jgi:hypothetical protein